MSVALNFNYMQQTTAAGFFNIQSTGWVQGMFVDDPAIRYQLAGGVLAQTETLPMYGGVGISETVNPNTGSNPPVGNQGGIISRATLISSTGASGALTGFSVFNQAYGMAISPQANVPEAASGMQVNFFRLGSNARVVVACAASLSSLEGGPITQQVSWDFVNQQLIPYVAAYNSASVSSATYTSSTGIIALTFSAAPLGAGIGSGANGVYISISGLLGTGVAPLNGDWPITGTASAGTVVSVQGPTGLGSLTITGSTGTLAAGGGALPVKVIQIESANSLGFNAGAAGASWSYTATVAVIEI